MTQPESTRPVGDGGAPNLGCSLATVVVAVAMLLACLTPVNYLRELATRRTAPANLRAVLDAQVTAWNAGDLDGFMAGYWNSEGLKFLSGDTVTTGWQATHDRYVKRYKSDGKEMGQLAFTDLEFEIVSADAAVVRGRWALTMTDGTHPHGLFTLLFRRIDREWKIVSDHTSAADPPKKGE